LYYGKLVVFFAKQSKTNAMTLHKRSVSTASIVSFTSLFLSADFSFFAFAILRFHKFKNHANVIFANRVVTTKHCSRWFTVPAHAAL